MASKLFFLFFIQAMMFFKPLYSVEDRQSDQGRHTYGGCNNPSLNFPVDLNLSSIKKESDEIEESSREKEEMNLELSLNSSIDDEGALKNGERAVKLSDGTSKTGVIKKTVTHKKGMLMTRQSLVVMGCMNCLVYVMTGGQRVCPRCQARDLIDISLIKRGRAGNVKKEIKREEERLVVMGCKFCYLYFMGIKRNPVCPKCKTRV